MPENSAGFFSSAEGLTTVTRYYDGLSPEQVERHMSLVQKAVDKLPEGSGGSVRILDAGCGNGNQDHELSLRFNAAVTGVTPFEGEYGACLDKKTASSSEATLKGIPDLYENVSFLQAGMPALEGVKGGFDIVYSDCAFQYMKGADRAATLSRFADLLNPGGMIALRYPDRPTFSSDSCHPSAADFRKEIEAFNAAASGRELVILDLSVTGDTLAEKRPEKNIQMIETILSVAPKR